jgi:hypothetical protein
MALPIGIDLELLNWESSYAKLKKVTDLKTSLSDEARNRLRSANPCQFANPESLYKLG